MSVATIAREKPAKLPKWKRPICGARCRDGHPCQAHAVPGKTRCRMHGGLSTGARTPEGKARQAEARRRIALAAQARAAARAASSSPGSTTSAA